MEGGLLTIFVKKILQPIEFATEAFANLSKMSKEGRRDSGSPPTWISAPCSQGGGAHLAFMPGTVIQVSIGAVHGPVAHGDDPRPDCPVLIGFLQRRVQSEGQGVEGGDGGGGGGAHPRGTSTGYLEVALQPVKLSLYQVAAIMEEEIYLGGEGDDVCGSQIPAGRVKGQGSEVRVSSASPILQGKEAGVPALPQITCTTGLRCSPAC